MNYGAMLGLALIIYSVITYIFDLVGPGFLRTILLSLASIAISVIGIILGTKAFRDKFNNGYISYGKALLTGILIASFAGFISSLYSYIFNVFIDPGYVARITKETQEWMIDMMASKGMSQEQLDVMVQQMQNAPQPSPILTAFLGVLMAALYGAIISLITSAFLKKNADEIESV